MIEAKKSFPSYSLKAVLAAILLKIRQDSGGWFLSVSADDPTKVSYCRKTSDKLSEKTRTKTSLQRFVRRQLQVTAAELSDSNLDKLANLVSLYLDDSLEQKIKIIDGDQITSLYNATNIRSCMTGPCSSYKTTIYALNKNKVKMVIFNNEVRALLWMCDDGHVVLDRAYPAGHWGVTFIRAWAKKKGYLLRNVPDSVTDERNNGISDGKPHIVTLLHDGIFPYMDTFKFGTIKAGSAVMSNDPKFGSVILTNTDGSYYNREVCDHCGCAVDNNSIHYISNGQSGNNVLYCTNCFNSSAFKCTMCGQNIFNRYRYRNWNMCIRCHGFASSFTKHNKCNCYNCLDKRRHYSQLIETQVLQENRRRNMQLSFDFAE